MAQPAAEPTAKADPIPTHRKVWYNGELLPSDQARVSVYDHGLLYGDGVFEGIRAYGGRVLKLKTHIRRLIESAKSIQLTLDYTADQLEQAVRETLAANELTDAYIRLCVTRGVGTLGLNPYLCSQRTTFIIADRIQLYPREMYESGLAVICASTVRNHPAAISPRIKSMNYLNNILAKIEAIQADCIEAVMLNHQGFVAECTGDNIFLVRQGKLWTPPLHAGILEGVTRNLVIELAEQAGIEIIQSDMTRHDLYVADECFLTGTAAEVIPVTKIDGRDVADGSPGPITLKLNKAFRDLIAAGAPED